MPSLAADGLSGPPRVRLAGFGVPPPSPVADPPEEAEGRLFSLMGLGTMAWRMRIPEGVNWVTSIRIESTQKK